MITINTKHLDYNQAFMVGVFIVTSVYSSQCHQRWQLNTSVNIGLGGRQNCRRVC